MTTGYSIPGYGNIDLLDPPIASHGEGVIHRTSVANLAAKIYHSCKPEQIQKLEVMIAHPPRDPTQKIGHVSIAWPTALLLNPQKQPVGFVMPLIPGGRPLSEVFTPKRRRGDKPGATWRHLQLMAMNLASIVEAVHEMGYVIADIKDSNFLVNFRSLVSIVDADSFQVRGPRPGRVFRCPVWTDRFTPPELIGADFTRVIRDEVHDRFGLAVVIHLLLFGYGPYSGSWSLSSEPPETCDLIRDGQWLYAPETKMRPGRLTMPLEILHPQLQRCFHGCFTNGHTNPRVRPKAREWREALEVSAASLVPCPLGQNHFYSQHLSQCYWCERSQQIQYDVFPSPLPVSPPPVQPSRTNKPKKPPPKVVAHAPAPALYVVPPPAPQAPRPVPVPPRIPARRRYWKPVVASGCLGIITIVLLCLARFMFSSVQESGVPTESVPLSQTESGVTSGLAGGSANNGVSQSGASSAIGRTTIAPIEVKLLAYPWASVTVDGQRVADETPASFALTPGPHLFAFNHPKQGTLEKSVEIESDRRKFVIKALFQEREIVVDRY